MKHSLRRSLVALSLVLSSTACVRDERASRSLDPALFADAPPPDARLPDVVDAAADLVDAPRLPDAADVPPRDVVDATVIDARVDAAVDVTLDAAAVDVTLDAAATDVAVDDIAAIDVVVEDASTSDAGATDASTSDAGATDATTPLMVGLTVHLENRALYDSAYAAALQSFAATFSDAGALLTLEPRDEVVADGSVVGLTLTGLEGAGNSVGSHAAAGMDADLTEESFITELLNKRTSLSRFVRRVDHVSGICSPLDFVGAAAGAGFAFTTGATAACILAMTDRPAGYEDLTCEDATDARCHAPYPTELSQRIHPWRAVDGAHWLTDDPAGRLVIIPSSGSVPCLTEEAASTGSLTNCRLDDSDVTTALADLDDAIAHVDPTRVNTYYWVWGNWDWSSTAVDPRALARLLEEVGRRALAGQVRWATAAQMYDAYAAWESTHR